MWGRYGIDEDPDDDVCNMIFIIKNWYTTIDCDNKYTDDDTHCHKGDKNTN